ncbi:hypothetical protein [Paracnuella aquatica]
MQGTKIEHYPVVQSSHDGIGQQTRILSITRIFLQYVTRVNA